MPYSPPRQARFARYEDLAEWHGGVGNVAGLIFEGASVRNEYHDAFDRITIRPTRYASCSQARPPSARRSQPGSVLWTVCGWV